MLPRDVVIDSALMDASHVMLRDARMDPAFGSGFFLECRLPKWKDPVPDEEEVAKVL